MKFVSKEAENLNIIPATLNSTQQPDRIFVTSFRLRDFYKLLPTSLLATTLVYGCSWAISLWAKHSPCIEDSVVDNRLEKIDFADLVKDAKSVAGFLLPDNFKLERMTSHKHSLAFETHFFSKVGTSKAETSLSREAECWMQNCLYYFNMNKYRFKRKFRMRFNYKHYLRSF